MFSRNAFPHRAHRVPARRSPRRAALPVLAVAALLLAAPRPVTAQDADAARDAVNPVVVRVNGEAIRQSELAEAVAKIGGNRRGEPAREMRAAVLERLIERKLLNQAARASGLHDDPRIRAQVEEFEEQLVTQAYLARVVEPAVQDDRLEARWRDRYAGNKGVRLVRASHILVRTEEEAEAVIADLADGADFATLARERSIDPSASRSGGDLGFFERDTMVEPFADAAFSMKVGSTSTEPVRSQFGWHVIKVEAERLEKAPVFAAARSKLREEASEEALLQHIDALRAKARVERPAE